jgi:putative SOS response-associated peptidase YedK
VCGRYTLKTSRRKIEAQFAVEELPLLEPRYNLGPTQDGLVVRPKDAPGTRTAALLRWGLIPGWTRAAGSAPLLINARAETVATKPAFRDAFKRRRCLVVADGFYEWSRTVSRKQALHFTCNHGEPFAMAGLWERWHPTGARPDDVMETYAIITTTANDVLAPHHDRMPVILDPEFYDDWLNPLLTHPEPLERLLRPYPAMRMMARAVNPRVNNIRHDDPACLEPPVGTEDADPASRTGQLDLGLGG